MIRASINADCIRFIEQRKEDLLHQGITDMANPNTSQRKQLIARLKSAIATAAIVGTLGGWLAFGTNQTSTAVTSTTTSGETVPAVAQSTTNSNTAASSATAATTSTTAATATSNSTAAQSSAATQASTSSSAPRSRRGAVTSTRSSR